jgi:hypothetical protein
MLFLICCGWVAAGILGYVLIRRDFIQCGLTWLNRDRVLWSVIGALFAPALLLTGLIYLFCDLIISGRRSEWFNRPSRW